MQQRTLGRGGASVSAIGYGCMGLTWAYGSGMDAPDERGGIAILNHTLDIGITLFDTADVYGPFTNELLVGTALHARRSEFTLATKCGFVVEGERTNYNMTRNGRPEHIRSSCDASLKRLQTNVIDLYQLHRVDPNVPVEESVGAMAELVKEGKVRAIGLSEVDVPTLKRAQSVHPIATLQSEYSLFERNVENEILPYCESQGIALLAFSPLGRGLLTGRLQQSELRESDFRSTLPRFQGDAFEHNAGVARRVESIAKRVGATSGQVALAWLLGKSFVVIPIPGTKHKSYLEENAAAAGVHLTPKDLRELDSLPPPMGDRYAQANTSKP